MSYYVSYICVLFRYFVRFLLCGLSLSPSQKIFRVRALPSQHFYLLYLHLFISYFFTPYFLLFFALFLSRGFFFYLLKDFPGHSTLQPLISCCIDCILHLSRGEIYHWRPQCNIFDSCVNFTRNQHIFSHN